MMKKRARMKAEGRVQTTDYKELCEAIRKKIKHDYEGYRLKKLREAAERRIYADIRFRNTEEVQKWVDSRVPQKMKIFLDPESTRYQKDGKQL
nr:unnamed protein product [Haemonchus contortus]